MASTIQLQSTVNWASSFIDFKVPTIGANNEPSITSANVVMQTILGPPFRWNWNRNNVVFPTVVGTQDYAITVGIDGAIVTFGFIEAASATIAGTITFRFLPVPDAIYTVSVQFQKKVPALFAALATTWTPIPDQYAYIYNYGLLALTMAYDDDPRFPLFNQKFIAHLLGAQQGLSETERNLFIDTWNLIARQEALMGIKTQQGRMALGT